jgi:hypothetical protein
MVKRRLLRLVAVLGLAAAALPGCGLFRELGIAGDDPQWVERRYRGVNSATILKLSQNVLQTRYPSHDLDLYRGSLTTGWVYGRYADITHQALRQRVVVETEPETDDVLVRIRVQQETSPSAGRVVAHDPGDWEPYDDDASEANRLMMRLHFLLSEVGERVVEPEETDDATAE